MFRKALKYTGFTALAGALLFASLTQVKAGSTTGSVIAQVITDLSIIQEQQLYFGKFSVSPTNAGTVTVNVSGTSTTGGVQSVTPGQRGQFKFQGAPNALFVFTVDSSTFNISNGSQTMQVNITNPFVIDQLNGSGNYTYQIDGQLNVNAGQQSGTYVGTYPVTINYF